MMTYLKTFTSYLFAFLFIFTSADANESTFWFGITTGYVVPIHIGTFNFANPSDKVTFGQHSFTLGTGSGYYIGLNGLIFQNKESTNSIGVNIGYSHTSSYSDTPGDNYSSKKSNGENINSATYFSNSFSAHSISAEFNLHYKPFNQYKLGVKAGLSTTYIFSSNYDYRYELDFDESNPEIKFTDLPFDTAHTIRGYHPRFTHSYQTGVQLYKGDLPDLTPLQISLQAGIFYDIFLENCVLTPGLSYRFPITTLTSSQSWRVSEFYFTSTLQFSI